MKLKCKMNTIKIDGDLIAVPVGYTCRSVLRVNETTEFILKKLEQDITEDDLISAVLREYDASEEEIRNDVKNVVGVLTSENLIE